MEKLDLYDVSVHEKDWKQFRKSATQEELLVLGIGVKYRLITKRLVSYLSVIGMILSVVIGLSMFFAASLEAGLIIAIAGYVFFAFLSTKYIRYSDSFGKIRKRLNKENRKALDAVFGYSAIIEFFDALGRLLLLYLTIPYQALMILVGMFAPNFVVAKNGVLIAIPTGCDIGNLAFAGSFYASRSLLEDWGETSYENSHKYTATFINDMGCEQTVHSPDGKSFYSEDGSFVGYSDDNGKHIKTK